ncbi:MAG: hypothetical protein HY302_14280 [Opitutae bacterium]|nr:hypothetical protein [Opitutae bacterium]
MSAPPVDPAAELLGRLRQVRASEFSAARGGAAAADLTGAGSVETATPGPATVDFAETGVWSAAGGPAVRFHNAYRWTRLGGALLRLEQIRLGPRHPVHLVDLAPVAGGRAAWASVGAHQCCADCYSAELALLADRVVLRWTVSGPRKNERLTSAYLHGAGR